MATIACRHAVHAALDDLFSIATEGMTAIEYVYEGKSGNLVTTMKRLQDQISIMKSRDGFAGRIRDRCDISLKGLTEAAVGITMSGVSAELAVTSGEEYQRVNAASVVLTKVLEYMDELNPIIGNAVAPKKGTPSEVKTTALPRSTEEE